MAGKIKTAGVNCPDCGEQMAETTYGRFCLACGRKEYGSKSDRPEKLSQRDVKETKHGQKRGIPRRRFGGYA